MSRAMASRRFAVFVLLVGALTAHAQTIKTDDESINVVVVTEGLQFPWGLAFLPDGRALVTERPGRLRLIDASGRLDPEPIRGVPTVDAAEQGGLLDVAIHPRFAENQLVYLSYSAAGAGDIAGRGTEVLRARLDGGALVDGRVIFRLEPKSRAPTHYGSRLAFDAAGFLFITLGDRSEAKRAQASDDLAGKVVRLGDDGRIPADNPFVGASGTRGEIFSMGHRNVQGAAWDAALQRMWIHEHGEDADDRLIVLERGANYGWPQIGGARQASGADTFARAAHLWTPTIAPSGMALYAGDRLRNWRGDLFVGSLKDRMLVRLKLDGVRVVKEERLLKGVLGRIRDVRNGPNGLLYLLVDDRNGKLVRLEPAPQ